MSLLFILFSSLSHLKHLAMCPLSYIPFIVERTNRHFDRAWQFASYDGIIKVSVIFSLCVLHEWHFSQFLQFLVLMFSVMYCLAVLM